MTRVPLCAPLVSVIIPAHNAERTLGETLASVQAQTYSNIEILVVDDGSRDATLDIARELAAVDGRIVLIRRSQGGGVASARNAGAALARGDYLAPVDADDLWHPTKLAKQMAVMLRSDKIGFVYTFYRHVDPVGRLMAPPFLYSAEGCVLRQHLLFNFVGNGSSLLLRRSA